MKPDNEIVERFTLVAEILGKLANGSAYAERQTRIATMAVHAIQVHSSKTAEEYKNVEALIGVLEDMGMHWNCQQDEINQVAGELQWLVENLYGKSLSDDVH